MKEKGKEKKGKEREGKSKEREGTEREGKGRRGKAKRWKGSEGKGKGKGREGETREGIFLHLLWWRICYVPIGGEGTVHRDMKLRTLFPRNMPIISKANSMTSA